MKGNLQVNGREMTFNDHPLVKGEWFEVDPKTINRNLFEKKGEEIVEDARRLICEAFEEIKKNPNKYARRFKVRIPKKVTYSDKRFGEIMELLNQKNEHIADWVELALVWAQRINNGESWKNLHVNVSFYERFIIWKNGKIAAVGGSTIPYTRYHSEYYICPTSLSFNATNRCEVPVIVSYDV